MWLWLAHAVGAAGVLVEWYAYAQVCGRAFRRWSAAGALLWATMYALLGAWTAALTMACTGLRSLVSDWVEAPARRHLAAAGFVVLFGVLTVVSWQGPVSLLPAFAVINTTLALFYLDNRRMRLALLASSVAWIANDVIWQAWPALLAESVAAVLNLRTLRRMGASGQDGEASASVRSSAGP